MATSLRVSEATRHRAAALAAQQGLSIGDFVELALEAYERADFWRQTREALSLQGEAEVDPAWERSIRDGLDAG